jgi:hypothetical protein
LRPRPAGGPAHDGNGRPYRPSQSSPTRAAKKHVILFLAANPSGTDPEGALEAAAPQDQEPISQVNLWEDS